MQEYCPFQNKQKKKKRKTLFTNSRAVILVALSQNKFAEDMLKLVWYPSSIQSFILVQQELRQRNTEILRDIPLSITTSTCLPHPQNKSGQSNSIILILNFIVSYRTFFTPVTSWQNIGICARTLDE